MQWARTYQYNTILRDVFANIKLYLHPNVIVVLFLGFSSGLPLMLTLSTLSRWMAEEGVSKATIGVFALVGLPYACKFVWAPLMDHLSLPWFCRILGRRRGWIIFTQCMLILSIIGLGFTNPADNPWATGIWALAVAFASASQDIVIDAFRVDSLDTKQQGLGAAVAVFGYRIGMLLSGAGALLMAEYLPWSSVYSIMACCILIGIITVYCAKEPDAARIIENPQHIKAWFKEAVIVPFQDFMEREQWVVILLFVVLYKMGDAFAGSMTNPFLFEMGFSKTEVATWVNSFGIAATMAGAFIGGVLVYRKGIMAALWICGILQLGSNAVFSLQAMVGHDITMLAVTISCENLSAGMGDAAFVAFLSSLCHREHTATQYALLSSLFAFGRTLLSVPSGWVAEEVNWVWFFILTMMIALPGLMLLKWLSYNKTIPEGEAVTS